MTRDHGGAAARAFSVDVGRLRHQSGAIMEVARKGHLSELQMPYAWVPREAEVSVDATLEAAGDEIVVKAAVTAPYEGECRRCLGPVAGEVRARLREIFSPKGDGAGGRFELVYPLRGENVDLAPLARDAVLLELPQAPLCRPDCAGLCPSCGAELNEGPCGCPTAATDSRWAALEQLRHNA